MNASSTSVAVRVASIAGSDEDCGSHVGQAAPSIAQQASSQFEQTDDRARCAASLTSEDDATVAEKERTIKDSGRMSPSPANEVTNARESTPRKEEVAIPAASHTVSDAFKFDGIPLVDLADSSSEDSSSEESEGKASDFRTNSRAVKSEHQSEPAEALKELSVRSFSSCANNRDTGDDSEGCTKAGCAPSTPIEQQHFGNERLDDPFDFDFPEDGEKRDDFGGDELEGVATVEEGWRERDNEEEDGNEEDARSLLGQGRSSQIDFGFTSAAATSSPPSPKRRRAAACASSSSKALCRVLVEHGNKGTENYVWYAGTITCDQSDTSRIKVDFDGDEERSVNLRCENVVYIDDDNTVRECDTNLNRVLVECDNEGEPSKVWYEGGVVGMDTAAGKIMVQFDDGEDRWVSLLHEKVVRRNDRTAKRARVLWSTGSASTSSSTVKADIDADPWVNSPTAQMWTLTTAKARRKICENFCKGKCQGTNRPKCRVLDLLSGAGGQVAALIQNGIDIVEVFYVEKDPDACIVYERYVRIASQIEDVGRDILENICEKLDVIMANYPCKTNCMANAQASAGRKKGTLVMNQDTMNHVNRVINVAVNARLEKQRDYYSLWANQGIRPVPRPDIFIVVENVISSRETRDFAHGLFQSSGYLAPIETNSSDYGTPVPRKRIFYTNILQLPQQKMPAGDPMPAIKRDWGKCKHNGRTLKGSSAIKFNGVPHPFEKGVRNPLKTPMATKKDQNKYTITFNDGHEEMFIPQAKAMELWMGYQEGHFSKLVSEKKIDEDAVVRLIGNAWSVPQGAAIVSALSECFASRDYSLRPYTF